jgi:hypothetical protein
VFLYDLNGNLIRKITLADWSNSSTNMYFGYSCSIGSGRLVIGSYGDNAKGSQAGAAYIYDLNGGAIKKITASDGGAGDHFGLAVAAGSGRIVVGSPNDDDNAEQAGAAYIFDLAGNQLRKIKAPAGQITANFGRAVAVGQERIVIGCPDEDIVAGGVTYDVAGAVYLFGMSGTYMKRIVAGQLSSPGTYQNAGAKFGYSVAVGQGKILMGQPFKGVSGVANTNGPGALYSTDLNGNMTLNSITGNPPSSNSTTHGSKLDMVGNSAFQTYGISCAIGNGITCVGGTGHDPLANLNPPLFSNVNGTIKIGKSLGEGVNSNPQLSIPLRGLQTADPVPRNRDLLDCLDER